MSLPHYELPKLLRFLRPWIHNHRFFYFKWAIQLEEKFPFFAKWNNVRNLAPGWKWGLSIVPLYQVLTGNPPVEKLDLKQSGSLMFTGAVWTYYATLIQPQDAGSRALALCNGALFLVNGYNAFRKYRYDQNKAKEALTQK
eukprot:TRINITY_DN648_c0_g1_i1.p1 TRINITY_DN648_c0_g1~~TRINITY_DN648_c0_g1_i1.p1  ORF type:complete len:155 (-),score=43.38 TRINITY_DN648_c0_g1_i1:19-441(-)